MKQFLLITLIALPSFLFAQPTITFNPANGATNVSLTVNLIISSTEGLNLTDGTNLNDTNVDGRIILVDGNSDPVPFDATIDGPRTTITVDPTSNLAELTTYTLTLLPVENNSGNETTPKVITFTTGDFTVPTFTVSQAINNIGTGFTFRVNVDENATVHYVVDRDATVPTELQIRAGDNGDGVNAEAAGSFVVIGGANGNEVITGLDFTPPVKFNIYFFAEDN